MTDTGFTIGVSSSFEGWWRYNVALMCGCFDQANNRTGFATAQSHIAEVGANLAERPAEAVPARTVTLRTPECNHLVLYLYIIPHTLPTGKDVASTLPFEIEIIISHNGKTLRTEKRQINQWSGASVEMKVQSEE